MTSKAKKAHPKDKGPLKSKPKAAAKKKATPKRSLSNSPVDRAGNIL